MVTYVTINISGGYTNNEQRKLLARMKNLIKKGKYRFADRKDINFRNELLKLGLTEHEAWFRHIMYLQEVYYVIDYKPTYRKDGESLVFKKKINNIPVYIKLKIEKDKTNNEECVCLSFHRDNWR